MARRQSAQPQCRLELAERAALAAGILRAMSLTGGFAPVLALIGHGASSENNPLARGLHCGACGGQTGGVNARALAALLGDPAVRAGLAAEGIDLADTQVVAGLHDTTVDEVTLYDLHRVPPSHAALVAELGRQLIAAGAVARRERAEALGLGGMRLSVFVEAPAAAIDAIIARHARVRDLVHHEWLFLHRIDPSSGAGWQRRRDGWHVMDGP